MLPTWPKMLYLLFRPKHEMVFLLNATFLRLSVLYFSLVSGSCAFSIVYVSKKIYSSPCAGYRFVGAIARAGLNFSYYDNQQCGSNVTDEQSFNGSMVDFVCDPPLFAKYVSLELPPSSPDAADRILDIAEIYVKEYKSEDCATNNSKFIGELHTFIHIQDLHWVLYFHQDFK